LTSRYDDGRYSRRHTLWMRIGGQWLYKTDTWMHETWHADIAIEKTPDGKFRYFKHRGGELRFLNEEELKKMSWIILTAERICNEPD